MECDKNFKTVEKKLEEKLNEVKPKYNSILEQQLKRMEEFEKVCQSQMGRKTRRGKRQFLEKHLPLIFTTTNPNISNTSSSKSTTPPESDKENATPPIKVEKNTEMAPPVGRITRKMATLLAQASQGVKTEPTEMMGPPSKPPEKKTKQKRAPRAVKVKKERSPSISIIPETPPKIVIVSDDEDNVDNTENITNVNNEKSPKTPEIIIINQTIDDIMTDDESIEEAEKAQPMSSVNKTYVKADSPVKSKVKAFEKLAELTVKLTPIKTYGNPIKTQPTLTGTKRTRDCLEKDTNVQENTKKPQNLQIESETLLTGNVRQKQKLFTPKSLQKNSINKYKPTTSGLISNSTSKVSGTGTGTGGGLSAMLGLTNSASSKLKPVSKLFQNSTSNSSVRKDSGNLEKLKEQQMTRNEELKRQREEKILKAHKVRQEMEERERARAIELQREKEERSKQHLAELAEKKQKLREEQEQRRLLAKQRVEMKKIEERKKLMNNDKPTFLVTQAPLLPSHDCYDSDHEVDPRLTRLERPLWTREIKLTALESKTHRNTKLKNSLFNHITEPHLQSIFQCPNIRCKRTSSAIWDKFPDRSILPSINDEGSDFSD